jgi:hypothetical protein
MEHGWVAKAASLWWQEIQDCLIMQRENEVGLLICRTFHLWEKACKTTEQITVPKALIWGRTYKAANELKTW